VIVEYPLIWGRAPCGKRTLVDPPLPQPLHYIATVMTLTDDDRAELARFLRDAIEADRYPLSPRARQLKKGGPITRPDAAA
jgi:hypothetical protein